MNSWYEQTVVGAICFLAGLLVGLLVRKRQATKRENTGEAAVRRAISIAFPGSNYHLFNDVTLPDDDGTTQIDHVLVSRFGVFVIETKNYTGWLFGEAQSQYWMQIIFQIRNRFRNPIHQNYKHVVAIRKLLDFLPSEVVNFAVVFTGDGRFKSERPAGVYRIGELLDFISSHEEEVMSENRMQFCVGRIESARRAISRKTDVEHQAYLDQKFGGN